jgi:hypothetical protein
MLAILHLLRASVANPFQSRRRLEVENFFLRHQLNIALRGVVPESSIRRIGAMRQNQRIILRDAYVLQLLDPTIMWEMSVNNRRGPCGS